MFVFAMILGSMSAMGLGVTPEEFVRAVAQKIPTDEASCVFTVNMATGQTDAMCGGRDLEILITTYKGAAYEYLAYPTAAFRKKNLVVRTCELLPATSSARAGTMICVAQKTQPPAN